MRHHDTPAVAVTGARGISGSGQLHNVHQTCTPSCARTGRTSTEKSGKHVHGALQKAVTTGGGASSSKLAGLPNYRFGGGMPGRRRVLAAAQVCSGEGDPHLHVKVSAHAWEFIPAAHGGLAR